MNNKTNTLLSSYFRPAIQMQASIVCKDLEKKKEKKK